MLKSDYNFINDAGGDDRNHDIT